MQVTNAATKALYTCLLSNILWHGLGYFRHTRFSFNGGPFVNKVEIDPLIVGNSKLPHVKNSVSKLTLTFIATITVLITLKR